MQQGRSRVTTVGGAEVEVDSTGTGRPMLFVAGWLGSLEPGQELPAETSFFEQLAAGARLVRYDRAGTGLSAPTGRVPSLEFELEQLDAVAATLGDEPFDLVGSSMGAPVAAAWTARHPERVRRLVLYGGWASGSAVASTARDHILGLVESHWGLGSDVLADIFAPDAPAESRAAYARYQRASSDAATARSLLELSYALDVSGLLAEVTVPTLVVHRSGDRAAPLAQAEALAAGIPGAKLVVLPGRSHLPYAGAASEVHELVAAIRRFLGLRASRRAPGTLTARQSEVAALVAEGLTNRQIAERVGIEERSAEGHIDRIRTRLGLASRAQLAAWYSAQKLG